MGVARDSHRRCIYYPEHVYTWEGYSSHSVSYPEHVYTLEGYSNRSVSYPEHVYTWEGYSNHSVSSCVCLSVCLHLIAS